MTKTLSCAILVYQVIFECFNFHPIKQLYRRGSIADRKGRHVAHFYGGRRRFLILISSCLASKSQSCMAKYMRLLENQIVQSIVAKCVESNQHPVVQVVSAEKQSDCTKTGNIKVSRA